MSLIINKVKRYVFKFEKIHSNFQTDNFSTTDISKKIFDKFGFSESTPPDYEQIKSRVFGCLNNAEEVISKELKFVTREIFNPEINNELKNKILKAIIDKDESRLWKNLLLHYLMNFDAEDKLILKISQNLKKKKELLSKRWLKRLEYINFLDVKNVSKKLSKKIYEQRKIEPVLFKSGLSGALTSSNLLVNTFYEMAKEAKDHPSDEKAFQFAQIVSENNKIKDSMGPQAMIGLLGKFSQNGNQNINPQLKTTIQNLF